MINQYDLHYIYPRMFIRTLIIYVFIFSLFLQNNIIQIINSNLEYQLINNVNNLLIASSNVLFFLLPFIIFFDLSSFILMNLVSAFDFTLRCFCLTLNMNVIFNPSFCYLSFHLWNTSIMLTIIFNYYLYKTYNYLCINEKIPGKFISSNERCPICLNNKSNWKLPCNHTFHLNCIKNWFQISQTCPCCRKYY